MRILFIGIILVISLLGNAQLGYKPIPFKDWENKKFPITDFITTNGDTLKQSFFEGKVCFLNFFLEGCVPCMRELKYLNRLSEKYSGDKDVCIVGIFIGSLESYKRYYKSKEIRNQASSNSTLQLTSSSVTIPMYPIALIDPYDALYKFNAGGGPLNVVVNKQGIVTKTWQGFAKYESDQENTYAEYISEVEECLK